MRLKLPYALTSENDNLVHRFPVIRTTIWPFLVIHHYSL